MQQLALSSSPYIFNTLYNHLCDYVSGNHDDYYEHVLAPEVIFYDMLARKRCDGPAALVACMHAVIQNKAKSMKANWYASHEYVTEIVPGPRLEVIFLSEHYQPAAKSQPSGYYMTTYRLFLDQRGRKVERLERIARVKLMPSYPVLSGDVWSGESNATLSGEENT